MISKFEHMNFGNQFFFYFNEKCTNKLSFNFGVEALAEHETVRGVDPLVVVLD